MIERRIYHVRVEEAWDTQYSIFTAFAAIWIQGLSVGLGGGLGLCWPF